MASNPKLDLRPKETRSEHLHVEEVGDEVLIYDLEGNRMHCLNAPAAHIWKLCDGRRTVREIADDLKIDLKSADREMIVSNTIGDLARLRLVNERSKLPVLISRRDITRRIGIAATFVTLPLISSILAPTSAQAASCRAKNVACTLDSQCCSGDCNTASGKCK
jgi:hypothetical protein